VFCVQIIVVVLRRVNDNVSALLVISAGYSSSVPFLSYMVPVCLLQCLYLVLWGNVSTISAVT
jgi:hypothetical protein